MDYWSYTLLLSARSYVLLSEPMAMAYHPLPLPANWCS